ncbi:MAG: SDR family oxidoreductase [Rhizobiales bacterium]|nr:SDR family oxidoreductase [Hyphomicrobiales bacterium]NRB13280.1 SDR family oxidoreductase [Hyphomicrobiales bacterium]
MFDLTGKVAIITGSSRGIGQAIAEQYARAGAKVVISSRNLDACEPIAQAIRDKGQDAIALKCNVGDKAQVQNLFDQTMKQWGRVDILVCNAATNPSYGPMSTLEDSAFDKVMRVNVQSTIWLSNLVTPIMIENGGGSIILLSSITALKGNTVIGAYGMSKAAEAALARNLAHELGKYKIRVNAIAPGLVKTEFARALWENPKIMARQEKATPLRRIGEPDDIAGVAHFLAARASAFVTGQVIVADGGETI